MRKKLLSIFTLLCLAVTSAWAQTSGECGEGVTWSYNAGTLTISGSGDMADYASNDDQPWKDSRTSITSVVIGSSVKSIGQNAFAYCSNLTSVTIPASVTTIGESAFSGCTGLTSVTIPASVTTIGRYAFYECASLTSVTIPASVTSIGQSAFHTCSGLKSVTFASGSQLTTIGESAFGYCSGLTSIEIPASVTSIGNFAFEYCSGVTSVTIPASVTTIGQCAFGYCSGLTSINFASGSQLTTIGEFAFYGCSNTNLTSIEIPASVTSIGNTAFKYCSGLTSVTVYSTSCTLGTQAFDECNNLANIYVFSDLVDTYKTNWDAYESKITAIGGNCGTTATWSLSSSGVLTISGSGAMADYEYNSQPWYNYKDAITSVVIGSSVTSIGESAFNGCSVLTSVTFAAGSHLESIGKYAFYSCSGLTSVTIPASVTTIGLSAFDVCSGLTSVTFAEGSQLTTIGRYAFYECASLTSVTIPASVTSIGQSAFHTCSGLKSVTFASGSHLTTIGESAFYYCSNTNLTSIEIPASVTSIGESVFYACFNLATVTLNSNPVIGTGAFPAGATVTMNLTANAAGTDYWMTFYNENYSFTADGSTTIYKGAVSGSSLTLTEVADIPKNNAAILKSTASPIVLTLAASTTADFTGNNLLGGTTVTAGYDAYTLSRGADGNGDLGFYKFNGTTLDPNKAHLELPQSVPSPSRGFIGFDDETTGISDASHLMDNGQWIMDNEAGAWYDLSGRKFAGQPTKRGIYILNGKKVVIR